MRSVSSDRAVHQDDDQGRRIEVRGTVQGVGFRPWVFRVAHELGLRGRVRNGSAGVTIEVYGNGDALDALVLRLHEQAPPAAEILRLDWQSIVPSAYAGFEIEPSLAQDEHCANIPADLPTCERCLAEIFDPSDRRHGYAFTNCTDCGPRFTLTRRVPYDRANTSMSSFPMCDACRAEYESPDSRRFHAEPNACPQCGPRLALLDSQGRPMHGVDPLAGAAEALAAAGAIVAIKGLGGYHLACDAVDEDAVAVLRRRKRRDAKPLAVMCANLQEAERLVRLDTVGRRMLLGSERPIVLAPRWPDARIAAGVSAGHDRLGVYLPYTPLHHLLLHRVGRPLVMTSANRHDEPSIHRDDDALRMLCNIADLFLVHDREIVTRTDDSVAIVIAGRPALLRRSRGYVPRAVALDAEGPVVLGCGAHLKNTFCLAVGDAAYLSPHMGDLESVETFDSYRETIERMERFLDVSPSVVAHDLHPDYLSTRYALTRAGVRVLGVQHHHAHIAAVMAEHHLPGPVLGLAWDGVGLGSDGSLWGGELLLADYTGFRRLATFRPIALAGGDTAVKQIWRTALAALDDAYEGDPPLSRLALFDGVEAKTVAAVRNMIATGVNAPAVHGVGRWFDAAAAIGLGRPLAEHEGQAAMLWEQACGGRVDATPYPWDIHCDADPWQVDLRLALRVLTAERVTGRSAAEIADRFHRTLIDIGCALVELAGAQYGITTVVLGGGCFQNAPLVEGIERRLTDRFAIYRNLGVPCGDGGLALGQIAVARALADSRGGDPSCA